jgi:hypothetical protein
VKNFFHLLNHSILKFYCPYLWLFKIIPTKFQTCLSQGPNTRGGRVPQPQTTPWGRPTPSTNQETWLDIWHSEHWPSEGKWV